MAARRLVPSAALSLVLFPAVAGCPGQEPPPPPAAAPASAAVSGSSRTASSGPAASARPAGGKLGQGAIAGVVKFTGAAPKMPPPKKRKEVEFCKDKDVPFNAVLVRKGKLRDVLVRIVEGIDGTYEPGAPAQVDQKDCMYSPRVLPVLPGQQVVIHNSDPTLHNVNAASDGNVLFNQAQPKGAKPLVKSFDEPGFQLLRCDIHTWMRTFIVVTSHPFAAVSGEDGAYRIERVPDGKYAVEAWHSHYGRKQATAQIAAGAAVAIDFAYDGTEPEPPENRGELADLW
ncbi:MAG: hypothetical protein HY744_01650 [Deltaproteobacteria bacterium]|nr:hypothetical protein [Deltaproteobacteria bacterium]